MVQGFLKKWLGFLLSLNICVMYISYVVIQLNYSFILYIYIYKYIIEYLYYIH